MFGFKLIRERDWGQAKAERDTAIARASAAEALADTLAKRVLGVPVYQASQGNQIASAAKGPLPGLGTPLPRLAQHLQASDLARQATLESFAEANKPEAFQVNEARREAFEAMRAKVAERSGSPV